MEQLVLEARSRAPEGKGAARKLRASGMVPGVAYGHGVAAQALLVEERALRDVRRRHHGANVLLDLRVDGESPGDLAAIIKAIQVDPISEEVLAVDFQWISLQEPVTITVAVLLEGAAPGVAQGGSLEQMLHEVEITCLPLQMPEELRVDISGMEVHTTLHVSDIPAPEGVEILTAGDEPVVTIRPPVSAAALEAQLAPEGEEGEEEGEEAEEE
jgi:large subunit ribosomal protein L25